MNNFDLVFLGLVTPTLRTDPLSFYYSVCVSPPQALSVHEKTTPSLSLFKPAEKTKPSCLAFPLNLNPLLCH